jgi:hypothetical protein
VDLSNPQTANIADLILVNRQVHCPRTAAAPTESTVFVVNATLTDFKLETGATGDSDYHLVLMDELGNTMVERFLYPVA